MLKNRGPRGYLSPVTDESWCMNAWTTSFLFLHCLLEVPTGFSSAATVETCLITSLRWLPFFLCLSSPHPYLGLALESQGLLSREPKLSREKEVKVDN